MAYGRSTIKRKANRNARRKEPDYIDYWYERQEKQYVRGYFCGKPRPPLIECEPLPIWFYFCLALLLLLFEVIIQFNNGFLAVSFNDFLIIGLIILLLVTGCVKLHKKKKKA